MENFERKKIEILLEFKNDISIYYLQLLYLKDLFGMFTIITVCCFHSWNVNKF